MPITRLKDCKEFISGDKVVLRELANAKTQKRDFRYSLAHAILPAGGKTKPHKMRTSEIYYIINGKGIMHIDEKSHDVEAGCMIDIPPGAIQHIENTGGEDLEFLCIVDPAWTPEDETIL